MRVRRRVVATDPELKGSATLVQIELAGRVTQSGIGALKRIMWDGPRSEVERIKGTPEYAEALRTLGRIAEMQLEPGERGRLYERLARLFERGLRRLPVRTAAQARSRGGKNRGKKTRVRDEWIIAEHAKGRSPVNIAAETQLGERRVRQIIASKKNIRK